MNYFDLHINDYQRKTAHLTLAEHGAYSLMLQFFYATERPLPADRKVLYRMLRADTSAERKSIDAVVSQFWQLTSLGLINLRAGEVLDNYRRWVDKQKANGSRGGRPPKTHGLLEPKPNDNPSVPKTETQTKAKGGDRARSQSQSQSQSQSHLETHSHSEAAPNGSRNGGGGGNFKNGSPKPQRRINVNGVDMADRYAPTTEELERREREEAARAVK